VKQGSEGGTNQGFACHLRGYYSDSNLNGKLGVYPRCPA
jgi:hypothetical protein